MALSETEKNDIKAMVLIEVEKMFTELTNRYNTEENHDMMLFLLDTESKIKQSLAEANS